MQESGEAERPSVIVVGSGFGGAVAACRLAQAGFDVLVLERGRRYERGDFPPLPSESALLPDLRRWTWHNGQGLWDVVDLDEIVSLQAAGYGGGSLIYANVHLRPPAQVFDSQWPEPYRGGQALEPYFDLAAYMLEPEPITEHPRFSRDAVKADQLRRAADHLGRGRDGAAGLSRGLFYPPLAISYEPRRNRHGIEQRGCTQCGRCSTGCSEGAKNTLDQNYLALAERHGARVHTQCEVTSITELDGGWAVRYHDHLCAERGYHTARFLFLCAGAVHTTRLLAGARLRRRSTAGQRRAGAGYFPGGDALGVVYDTRHPQYPSRGPTITSSVVHWESEPDGSFFMIQDGGYGRELERLLGVLRAPAWLGRNRLSRVAEAGHVPVGASPEPSPPVEAERSGGFELTSILDDVASAWACGALSKAIPAQLRDAWSSAMAELEHPQILADIVERTIDRVLRDRHAKSWLGRWGSERIWVKWIMLLHKAVVRSTFGTSQDIARHALRAALSAGAIAKQELLGRALNHDSRGASHRTMLLAMGRDAARGVLRFDRQSGRVYADLDLYHLAPGYTRQEQLMTDLARALGGELRVNPAWTFLGKPVTVHSQGGCRMGDDVEQGVTDPDGAVYGCHGLYVMDGALLCTSVGVNPSATILAIAERNIERFIRRHGYADWGEKARSEGEVEYARHRREARAWAVERGAKWDLSPPVVPRVAFQSEPLGLRFREWMQGYYAPTSAAPRSDAEYRAREAEGRPDYPVSLALENSVADLNVFFEDMQHELTVRGTVKLFLPGARERSEHRVDAGALRLFVPRHKPYGMLRRCEPERFALQERAAGAYTTVVDRPPPGRDVPRFLRYALSFRDDAGQHWLLSGKKRIKDDPGFDAWRDTTSLFVELYGPLTHAPELWGDAPAALAGAGVVHVDVSRFLYEQLPSFEVTPAKVRCGEHSLDADPARVSWAIGKFVSFFYVELQRIYAPEVLTAVDSLFRRRADNVVSGNATQ